MLEDIRKIISTECNIQPELPLIVGVSGGPDSLCMLDILNRLGYSLIVAHFDHSLRPDSGSEANFVKDLARKMGLDFLLEIEDVKEYAELHKLSIEEAARYTRYEFFIKQAELYEAQAVAVGHTSDDQVETILMHFLRGTGMDGLKGMPFLSLPNTWSQRIPIVRPILTLSRQQVAAYNQSRNISPIFDRSNLDTTFFRNRLRHELIPELETYNPQIKSSILHMADTINEDYAFIKNAVNREWENVLIDINTDYIALNLPYIRELPLGLLRRIIRSAVNNLCPGLQDFDYGAVKRATDFINTPSQSNQMDLISNLYLLIEDDRLWISKWNADLPVSTWPQLQLAGECYLHIPGALDISKHWRFETRLLSKPEVPFNLAQNNRDPFQVWLDSENIKSPIVIRPRRPGDRFKPFGMGGRSVKVSDHMVNQKLPRRVRQNWPIVFSGEDIIWIPGFNIAHGYQICSNTKSVVNIKLARK